MATGWRPSSWTAAFALLLAVAGGAAIGAASVGPTLVVTDAETGERLLEIPVAEGTTVTLAYTHSVERTPVRDRYVVRDGRLVMTRMTFESYGWGLPASADVERVNGSFVAKPNRSYTSITVAPGRVAGHRLIVGDRTVDLVALADGRSVRLAVRDPSPVSLGGGDGARR